VSLPIDAPYLIPNLKKLFLGRRRVVVVTDMRTDRYLLKLLFHNSFILEIL